MKEQQRLDFLDVAKGVGISLVVLGHLLSTNVLRQVIYAFHMPLFFFITGYIIYSNRIGFSKDRICKLFKSLLIPYFSFSFLYLFVYEWPASISGIKDLVFKTLCLRGMAPLWFLASLCFAELIFLFALQIKRDWIGHFLILILILINVFCFSKINLWNMNGYISQPLLFVMRTSLSTIFVGGGYYYAFYISNCREKYVYKAFRACLCLIMVVALVKGFNLNVNLHLYDFSNQPLFLITGWLGAIGTIEFCQMLHKCNWLKRLGQQSLGVMAVHYPITKMIGNQIQATFNDRWMQIMLCIVIAIPVIAASFWVTEMTGKYAPWLFGKNVKQKTCMSTIHK
jgi:fucose 4-O-acetylase-like acetyltransferase